jgi:DNA-binding transcriptional ArsR family regulator
MESPVVTIEDAKANTEKWGEALAGGFVVIPSALLRYQSELKLDNGEMLVLMNLFMHWWKANDLPFPHTSTLAKRMGVTRRTVQRHVESLERKELIRRVWDTQPNPAARLKSARYDLRGIADRLRVLGAAPYGAWKRDRAVATGTAKKYEDPL